MDNISIHFLGRKEKISLRCQNLLLFPEYMIRNNSPDFQLSIDVNGIIIRLIYRVLLTVKISYLIMKDPIVIFIRFNIIF